MLSFISRRFLSAIPTLFIIITISFFLIRLAPGGPFDLERPLEAKVMENLQKIYGLDRPLFEQYVRYLAAVVQGDFGPSFIMRDFSVAELFANGLPVSIRIGALALGLVDAYSDVYLVFGQTDLTNYSILVTFGLLVAVLAVRPLGLFGRPA